MYLANINKKLSSCLADFDSSTLSGGGVGKSVKKEKFVAKIFFQINVEWNSKNLSKLEIQCKRDSYIRFNIGLYSIHLDIVC